MDKIELVARILQAEGRQLVMIFTRTKRKAQKIMDDLTERGFAVGAVHGDLGQGAREQALRAFRNGKVDVLVATDVAARGIDVDNVTHVINYECPDDEKTYLHRVGRTGRAGNSGVAVTLVDWEDIARWQMIDRALKLPFKDPIETYSSSDHVFTGLNIPRGVTGRLPKAQQTRTGIDSESVEDIELKSSKRKPASSDRPARSDKPKSDRPKTDKPKTDKPKAAKSDQPAGEAIDKAKRNRARRRTKSGELQAKP
jgi:superfamily II DNA/RNA helicase